MYKNRLKHFLGIAISLVLLVAFSPFLLLLMVFIALKTRENPFFTQKRMGLNGKIFTLIKLRTMTDKYDSEGNQLIDMERTSAWGRFLRKTSIDEIPQLINILKGDMNLIGPRPLLPEMMPYYSAYQNQRHEIRPGITGWAQINGRNTISWRAKFDLDVWYVKNVNFKIDFQIFFRTIQKIFGDKNVNYSDSDTMPDFDGTN
ncbi:sugar transferase [Bacteroidia bacterium]|nr:sugar transferase [Bacteroidia bacterium]